MKAGKENRSSKGGLKVKTKILSAILGLALSAGAATADVLTTFQVDFGGGNTATITVERNPVTDTLNGVDYDALIISGVMDQAGNVFNTVGVTATPSEVFNQTALPPFVPATPFLENALFVGGFGGPPAEVDSHVAFSGNILDPGGHIDGTDFFQVQASVQPVAVFSQGELARLVVPTGAHADVSVLALGFAGPSGDRLVGLDGTYGFNTEDFEDTGDELSAEATGSSVLSSSFDAETAVLTVVVEDNNGRFADSFFDIFVDNAEGASEDITVNLEILRNFVTDDPINGLELRSDTDIQAASSARFPNGSPSNNSNDLRLFGNSQADHVADGGSADVSFSMTLDTSEGSGSATVGFTLVPTPAAFLPGLAMLGMAATRRRRK